MQVVLSVEESALTDVCFDQHLPGSCICFNNSGPIAIHELYKTNDISCKNTFGVN